jgi:hypothetical protein
MSGGTGFLASLMAGGGPKASLTSIGSSLLAGGSQRRAARAQQNAMREAIAAQQKAQQQAISALKPFVKGGELGVKLLSEFAQSAPGDSRAFKANQEALTANLDRFLASRGGFFSGRAGELAAQGTAKLLSRLGGAIAEAEIAKGINQQALLEGFGGLLGGSQQGAPQGPGAGGIPGLAGIAGQAQGPVGGFPPLDLSMIGVA